MDIGVARREPGQRRPELGTPRGIRWALSFGLGKCKIRHRGLCPRCLDEPIRPSEESRREYRQKFGFLHLPAKKLSTSITVSAGGARRIDSSKPRERFPRPDASTKRSAPSLSILPLLFSNQTAATAIPSGDASKLGARQRGYNVILPYCATRCHTANSIKGLRVIELNDRRI